MGLNKEEAALVHLYQQALLDLAYDDRKYGSNVRRFNKWDDQQRLNWVYRMEHEALKELPFAVELVGRAVAMKVTQ